MDRASPPAGWHARVGEEPLRELVRARQLVRQPDEVCPAFMRDLNVPAVARPRQADAPPVHVVHVVVGAPQRERLRAHWQERVDPLFSLSDLSNAFWSTTVRKNHRTFFTSVANLYGRDPRFYQQAPSSVSVRSKINRKSTGQFHKFRDNRHSQAYFSSVKALCA